MKPPPAAARDFEFLQALLKRGFVNLPRMLFDYSADLGLDYDTIGRVFALMVFSGGPAESAFEPHLFSRKTHPRDFDQLRVLIEDLEQKDLVRAESESDRVSFSFIPLLARLRAVWEQYRDLHESEKEHRAPHPAVSAVERVLGKLLSPNEVTIVQDWMDIYGFDLPMVATICQEGLDQGRVHIHYLNRIATQWYEDGVRTPDEAAANAQRYRKSIARHRVIIQYLGLKRITGAEKALIEKWTDQWGFSNEVIQRACDQAVGKENPLQYTNRVLESWHERNVKTVAEAEELLREFKRRTPAREAESAQRARKGKSNVFLQREKKDDEDYDYIYEPFGK